MKESAVEKFLVKEVEKRGGMCLKFTSPSRRGVNDRLVMLNGVHMVELKAPGKSTDPSQRVFIRKAARAGVDVHVLDSLDSVRGFLKGVIQ